MGRQISNESTLIQCNFYLPKEVPYSNLRTASIWHLNVFSVNFTLETFKTVLLKNFVNSILTNIPYKFFKNFIRSFGNFVEFFKRSFIDFKEKWRILLIILFVYFFKLSS